MATGKYMFQITWDKTSRFLNVILCINGHNEYRGWGFVLPMFFMEHWFTKKYKSIWPNEIYGID